MAKSYSYDPAKLMENGRDRMRMELGDTTFAPGELTAALCDEEYDAILGAYPKWRKAKLKCLEAILMRFAHQVNTSIDGISYSFADRVDFWKQLYSDEKKNADIPLPRVNPASLNGRAGGPPYFYEDMQTNARKALNVRGESQKKWR